MNCFDDIVHVCTLYAHVCTLLYIIKLTADIKRLIIKKFNHLLNMSILNFILAMFSTCMFLNTKYIWYILIHSAKYSY